MTRGVVLLAALLAGCHRQEGSVGSVSAGGMSAGGAAAVGSAGETSGAGGGSLVTTKPRAAAPVPDNYDASGCTHPEVKAECQNGWCKIPAGCFVMGSPESEWDHAPQEQRVKVTLTRPFVIGQTEVTQRQWLAAGLPNPSRIYDSGPMAGQGDGTDPECPVGNVNWFEAVSYANHLSEQEGLEPCYVLRKCTGELGVGLGLNCESFEITKPTIYECKGYRLPTDPEWEYAARAGARTAYYNGDITTERGPGVCVDEPALDGIAWYCSNAGPLTHPVGKLKPNAWGLFDVIGNASEWSNDQAGWVPKSETVTDPDQTFGPGQARDWRGGASYGWPALGRLAARIGLSDDFKQPTYGFRLAKTLP